MTELDRIGGLYFSALLESSLSTERYNRQRIVSGFHIWVTMVSLPQAHEGSGFASTSDCLCRISLPKTPILRNWCIWVRKLQSHAGRLNKKNTPAGRRCVLRATPQLLSPASRDNVSSGRVEPDSTGLKIEDGEPSVGLATCVAQ